MAGSSLRLQFRKSVLGNGLRVVTEFIPHARSVSLGIWATVGSRDEHLAQNGLAHLFEHMVFKGTRQRDAEQIAFSLESVGGHLDAFTTKEVVCFNAQVLEEHLELAVDILSDLICEPLLAEADLKKERQVVITELEHTDETPDELVFERFFGHLFDKHPLGYPIGGTPESVGDLTVSDLKTFRDTHFMPERLVIAAAGNVDHDRLVDLFEKHLHLPSSGSPRQIEVPKWPGTGSFHHEFDGSQLHLCLGFPAYSSQDPKKYPLSLVNTYLGGGMSSRLFQRIREDHALAYAVYSFTDYFLDCGIFGIYAAIPAQHQARTQELIETEINSLLQENIDETTLQQLKSQIKGNVLLGLETTGSRMSRIANLEIYNGRFTELDEVVARIEAVTSKDFQEVVHDLFAKPQSVLTTLGTK